MCLLERLPFSERWGMRPFAFPLCLWLATCHSSLATSPLGEVVLTFDLDYPALLALRQVGRASAIVFRTVIADPAWINSRLPQCLPLILQPLNEGAIVVVEDDRLRIRLFVEL